MVRKIKTHRFKRNFKSYIIHRAQVREQTAAILGHPVVVSYISRLECEKITSNLKSTNKVSEFKKVRIVHNGRGF